jgi:hypothetical protein
MPEKKRKDKFITDEVPEEESTEVNLDLDIVSEDDLDKVEDHPLGFVLVDTDTNELEDNPLDIDNTDDSITIGTNSDLIMDQIDDYTDDPDILDDFAERQETNYGSNRMLERFGEHNSRSPDLTGDDIDADWEYAYQGGEETVGASNPTPDQDIVEELGEAAGLEYEYDEELNTLDKLVDRDKNRFELSPDSLQEAEEELWNEEMEDDETAADMDRKATGEDDYLTGTSISLDES